MHVCMCVCVCVYIYIYTFFTGGVTLKGPPYFYLAGGPGDLFGDKVPQEKMVSFVYMY